MDDNDRTHDTSNYHLTRRVLAGLVKSTMSRRASLVSQTRSATTRDTGNNAPPTLRSVGPGSSSRHRQRAHLASIIPTLVMQRIYYSRGSNGTRRVRSTYISTTEYFVPNNGFEPGWSTAPPRVHKHRPIMYPDMPRSEG